MSKSFLELETLSEVIVTVQFNAEIVHILENPTVRSTVSLKYGGSGSTERLFKTIGPFTESHKFNLRIKKMWDRKQKENHYGSKIASSLRSVYPST